MPPRKLKPHAPLPERVEALEASVREAWERWRGLLLGMFILWLISVLVAAWLGKGISANATKARSNSNDTRQAQRTADVALISLRDYEIGSCHRSNLARARDNRSNLDDYNFEKSIIHLIAPALAHPPPQPGVSPRDRARQTRFAQHLLAAAKASAADKVWGHLIEDCTTAVEHPATYRFPPLVRFVKELPPVGALHVGPGE